MENHKIAKNECDKTRICEQLQIPIKRYIEYSINHKFALKERQEEKDRKVGTIEMIKYRFKP